MTPAKKSLTYLTLALTVITGLMLWLLLTTPNASAIKGCLRTSIYSVWLCQRSPSYVRLSQISPTLREVVILSEDGNFYHHSGFDWAEMHKSLDEDLLHGRIIRGGSTITQQLAKNVFLSKQRTILRKLREAYLTVQLEAMLSKNQILEKYLNVIEFGPHLYGIKAAAQYYFNKPPSDLNLLESAYLAFLIPNPRVYSKTYLRKELTPFSRFRVLELCYLMYATGRITESEYLQARQNVDLFPWNSVPAQPPVTTATAGVDMQKTTSTAQAQQPQQDLEPKPVEPSPEERTVDPEAGE